MEFNDVSSQRICWMTACVSNSSGLDAPFGGYPGGGYGMWIPLADGNVLDSGRPIGTPPRLWESSGQLPPLLMLEAGVPSLCKPTISMWASLRLLKHKRSYRNASFYLTVARRPAGPRRGHDRGVNAKIAYFTRSKSNSALVMLLTVSKRGHNSTAALTKRLSERRSTLLCRLCHR